MTAIVIVLLCIASAPVWLAMTVLSVEILAALLPSRHLALPSGPGPRCAVLIPAHNEESGIERTIASVGPQLHAGDPLLVVADNCTDGTAATARAAGARVVERTDAVRRGKGYALDFGIRELEQDSPAVIVVVDADCVVEAGSIDRLVRLAAATGRPIQAGYDMDPPPGFGARSQLSAFCFALKNTVRPRGLARLGLPCLLTGTGMAFPTELIRSAPLASGNIVEDMQLGIDLALAGRAPLFCAEAHVRSELPASSAAAVSQRTRWIHGHLTTLIRQAPRLLVAALRQRRIDLAGLALELSVPPLSLLLLLAGMAGVLLTIARACGGSALPASAATVIATTTLAALGLAWLRFGRRYLSVAGLLAVPVEIVSRIVVLAHFLRRPQATWIRTERRTL